MPQLAIGCILFTVFGLLGTYWLANALTGYFQKHPIGPQRVQSTQAGNPK